MPDVWCSFCEKDRGDIPNAEWWEVKTLGPERRVHAKCFRAGMAQLHKLADGEFVQHIEEREQARGITR